MKLEGGVVCVTFGEVVVIVEAGVVETGVVEVEIVRAGVDEARVVEAGVVEAEVVEAEVVEAEVVEAGVVEAGVVEAEVVEAVVVETGVVDGRVVIDDDCCDAEDDGDGPGVVFLGQVDCDSQSHIFLLLFHSRPAEHCITTGLPLPSG
jgi:hypothetical protein